MVLIFKIILNNFTIFLLHYIHQSVSASSNELGVVDDYGMGSDGVADSNSEERLYHKAVLGEFNYVAFVTSKAGICTGTILNTEWVLTAAHCFIFREKVIGHREARVIAGITDHDYPEKSKQDMQSSEIHVHPHFWNGHLGKFDVALVRLRDPLEFGPEVGSISIAGDQWPQVDSGNIECFQLGYGGFYTTAPATSYLKAWNVTAGHNITACPCVKGFQYKRMVCVHEKSHPMMCQGDDGGPLICGGEVRAIGHMVYATNCGDIKYPTPKCYGDELKKAISTYTLLCPMLNWMHEELSEIPVMPSTCRTSLLNPHQSILTLLVLLLLTSWRCQ